MEIPTGSGCFGSVEQVAFLRRHLRQQAPEVVALMTRLPSWELTAAQWPAYTRAAWGMESGLHQCLDDSDRQDACRVRRHGAIRLMAMLRRFSDRLLLEWRSGPKRPDDKTTIDVCWCDDGRT